MNDQSALRYIESRRWPHGPRCPVCTSKRHGPHSSGLYRCLDCAEVYSVRTGTVMERSHVPLQHWLTAMQMRADLGAWPTSPQLARAIGIRQPTAWSMLRRLREALP